MRPFLRPLGLEWYVTKFPLSQEARRGEGFEDGAKRIRTADPLHAMQVLYQLSYGPVGGADTEWLEDPVGLVALSCAD